MNHVNPLLIKNLRVLCKVMLRLAKLDNPYGCTYIVFMIKFAWDHLKAQSNLKKHGVSFDEAKSVFYDEFAIQFFDDENSFPSEDRFLMLGMSNESKVLVVCHCERDHYPNHFCTQSNQQGTQVL